MRGIRITRGQLGDAALAVVVGVLVLTTAAADSGTAPVDLLLVVVGSAALAFHRMAPRAVLAVASARGAADVGHPPPPPHGTGGGADRRGGGVRDVRPRSLPHCEGRTGTALRWSGGVSSQAWSGGR
ncbi:hypothetical protein [Streptomyces sp. NPDC059018]|uniref:hypothetical protein n=1 Tax=Streptomyces sp. NPDC059018 TaxID=3346701 RepID=UPI0036844CFF